jgi:hypothetical protein
MTQATVAGLGQDQQAFLVQIRSPTRAEQDHEDRIFQDFPLHHYH